MLMSSQWPALRKHMQKYVFELTGISPLLMHHNNIDERDKIEATRKRMKHAYPVDTQRTRC